MSRRETDISLLVEETVARFRNSTEKIAIRTDCPDAHVLFYADGEAFTKILSNLLANALKYARSTVVVVLRILDDDRSGTTGTESRPASGRRCSTSSTRRIPIRARASESG